MNWSSIENCAKPVIEIGCGYGTFSVPVAARVRGKLVCHDIEKEMLCTTKENLDRAGLPNYELMHRDVIDEALRSIGPGGTIAVIHWRKDIKTPRGLAIVDNGAILEPYHWGVKLTKKK